MLNFLPTRFTCNLNQSELYWIFCQHISILSTAVCVQRSREASLIDVFGLGLLQDTEIIRGFFGDNPLPALQLRVYDEGPSARVAHDSPIFQAKAVALQAFCCPASLQTSSSCFSSSFMTSHNMHTYEYQPTPYASAWYWGQRLLKASA